MDDQIWAPGDPRRQRRDTAAGGAVAICEYNKLIVTPFRDWRGERTVSRVPGLSTARGEPTRTDRPTLVAQDSLEEDVPPLRTQTCGWGPGRALDICLPGPRACEHG